MQPSNEQLATLAERYGLRDIYAFGSRAMEIASRISARQTVDTSAGSDVDIAIQPLAGRHLAARDRVRLVQELEDFFDAPRVDLVILSEASPFLAVEVIRGELLFTADPLAQAEHELYVLRRAADLAVFQRERVHQILTGGAR